MGYPYDTFPGEQTKEGKQSLYKYHRYSFPSHSSITLNGSKCLNTKKSMEQSAGDTSNEINIMIDSSYEEEQKETSHSSYEHEPSKSEDYTILSQQNYSFQYPTNSTLTEDPILKRLTTLETLKDQGFVDEIEFQRRKEAILNDLTHLPSTDNVNSFITTHSKNSLQNLNLNSNSNIPNEISQALIHRPDFSCIPAERAIKHSFHYSSHTWESEEVWIKLDEKPFAKGSLRLVYHLEAINHKHESKIPYVAKLAIDPDEDLQTYFRDIELQAHCAWYAEKYNEYQPPKRVEFIKAWVLELTQRNGALCAVETFINGTYRKHNNNFGYVSEDERNTPQAFSHFTLVASHQQLLAVDIQGVGDLYTDPQIHTSNGNDFGKGNLGAHGIQRFLSTHRCNPICRYLKLPPNNPKEYITGTVPLQALMTMDSINPVHFESKHYYEENPRLQKFIIQCKEEERKEYVNSIGTSNISFCCGTSPNCIIL